MIEKMINEVKMYLPLLIEEITWDGAVFNMYGQSWAFATLSAWRISTNEKVIYGCYDKNSKQLINSIKNIKIIDISFQSELLKIDPIFYLSNELIIEIFSTDTFEPWTFQVNDLPMYIATPNIPENFWVE